MNDPNIPRQNQQLIDAVDLLVGDQPYHDGANDADPFIDNPELHIISSRVREVLVHDSRTRQARTLSDLVLSTAVKGDLEVHQFRFAYLATEDAESTAEVFTLDMDTGALAPPNLDPTFFSGDPAQEFLLRLGRTAVS